MGGTGTTGLTSAAVRRRGRRSGEANAPVAADSAVLPDLQSLLTGALHRLSEAVSATQASAWALRPSGEAYVAAHVGPGDADPRGALAALGAAAREAGRTRDESPWQLERASDLADERLAPEWRDHLLELGFSAGVALVPDGQPVAVLLITSPDDPPAGVRPRTLAALDEAAERLRTATAASLTLSRLGVADEELRRLDRLATLGELLVEVVHEVRNPLVAVKTFLQLLPERGDDAEFQTHFHNVVGDEVRRMERLLDTVLQHASPSAPDVDASSEATAALRSIAGLLEVRARDREIALTLDTPEEPLIVAISEDALRQIVLNLALNALEATPAGGAVLLEASAGDDVVELCVEDTGPGVDDEMRERLFEPFSSNRRTGPGGLGLAITRRLVEEAGGTISFDNVDHGGKGARFQVRIPATTR